MAKLKSYKESRIAVQTNLNVNRWRKYMTDYFEQQLPDLIEYGFPLYFDRNSVLIRTYQNHPLANKFYHVDNYITEELKFIAIMEPFSEPLFDFYISGAQLQICAALKVFSLNDGVAMNSYFGTEFQLQYPSV